MGLFPDKSDVCGRCHKMLGCVRYFHGRFGKLCSHCHREEEELRKRALSMQDGAAKTGRVNEQ